jgi:hypothetical protein
MEGYYPASDPTAIPAFVVQAQYRALGAHQHGHGTLNIATKAVRGLFSFSGMHRWEPPAQSDQAQLLEPIWFLPFRARWAGFTLQAAHLRASGLRLVTMLAHQLNGTFEVERGRGARCIVRFPDLRVLN